MNPAAGNKWAPYGPGKQYPGPKAAGQPGRITSWLRRKASWLRSIGKARDPLLVTATIVYIAGYIVWSYNSLRNKLGLLPALDPQYFVAGLIPVLVVSAGYLLASGLKQFFVHWMRFVGEEASGIGSILRPVLLWAFWGALVLVLLGPIAGGGTLLVGYTTFALARWLAPDVYESLRRFSFANAYDSAIDVVRTLRGSVSGQPARAVTATDRWLAPGLFLVGLAVFRTLVAHRHDLSLRVLGGYADWAEVAIAYSLAVTATFLPPMKRRGLAWVAKSYRAFWVYIAVPLVVALAIAFYLVKVYPDLPQEFGGVKPRCASLDVVRAQLSVDTLRDLVSDDQISPAQTQSVVRSVTVEVLSSGSSVVQVRSQGRVYEISKAAIQAIIPCD